MATDAQNLKISRVTVAGKTAFSSATLASGSIYWDESEKRVVVGDGVTPGGVKMAKESEFETALKELIVEFGGQVPV